MNDFDPCFDVVIAGGAVVGSATAYFLATHPGFRGRVLVLERDTSYRDCATTRSVASIRHQFSTPQNIQLSMAGTAFIRQAEALLAVDGVAPGLAFREAGYLFLAHEAGLPVLRHNHAVQRAQGANVALLDAADLAARPPERETVIDETRRSYSVSLDGIRLPAASLITGASAKAALRAIRDTGWLLNSALAAGGIAGVLDVVVDYLNTRTTFGRKIGSYQSLKHTCADILVGLERSRSHVYHAATRLADGEDAEIALRMAKAESGDTFVFAGDRAVQFHGGFGFTYDCDAQLFLRRAIWLQSGFGDAAHHRRHLADLLLSPTA
jgi:hypothetical protein